MVISFADFELDPDNAELRRAGQPISVEPQVFDLIVFLASNAGRILSRDEIMHAVWRGRIVSDSAISTRINAARRALGDDGAAQRIIKTVHGRGFRFEAAPAASEQDSASLPLHHFPVRSTTLIGRERESALLERLIAAPDVRLVTLTGAGGSGKTRLAQHVATAICATFPDGAWFVDLAPLRHADLVETTIAQALGVAEAADRPLLESVKNFLRARRLLLVLDNFEHVLPAANAIAELLHACPGLRVLATSRAPLRISGEHELPVPPLAVPGPDSGWMSGDDDTGCPAAMHLFEERARAVRPEIALTTEARRAIAGICVRLDGLPLAIELAAARVRTMTPAEILARLEQRLPVLTGGPRDLPVRQQTLRNTLSWSFELLRAEQQWLSTRLAVFAGGFTADAAQAILRREGDADILDNLDALVENSLVQRHDVEDGSRYSVLETLREFASEHLHRCEDLDEVRRRHAEHFLAFAQRHDAQLRGRRQMQFLARLTREHDNLRAALTWALDIGADASLGARLAGALWWFWGVRGHVREGRRWIAMAMRSEDEITPETRAWILRARANFAFLQGDYVTAGEDAERAHAILAEIAPAADAAWVQGLQGIARQYQGDTVRARRLLEAGLAAARALDDGWLIAWMLRNLGRIAHDCQDDERATQYLEESLLRARHIGDTRGTALSLHYLGVVALPHDPQQAHEYLLESIELFRELGDVRGLAWALHYLAAAALDLEDVDGARRAETESLALRNEIGDKRGIAECLEGHACLLGSSGLAREAVTLFGTAHALREAITAPGSPADRRRTQRYLAAARAELDPSLAEQAWQEGVATPVERAIDGLC